MLSKSSKVHEFRHRRCSSSVSWSAKISLPLFSAVSFLSLSGFIPLIYCSHFELKSRSQCANRVTWHPQFASSSMITGRDFLARVFCLCPAVFAEPPRSVSVPFLSLSLSLHYHFFTADDWRQSSGRLWPVKYEMLQGMFRLSQTSPLNSP